MRRILSLLLLVAVLFGVEVHAQTKVLEGDFLQGGAQAERNYIKNSEIEKNITGYVRFADGASLANGAGSVSPTASIAFGNTSPLSGSGNLVYTPGAAANQGWSVDFKIDRKHLASMLTVQFDYEFGTAANYTCGPLVTDTCDLKVAVYDKDSGTFVQVLEGERIQKVSGPFTHKAKFQTHITDVNYRLIVYQTTTTTTWVTAKFDSIKVGPQATPRGPPVSDWISFTSTITPNTNIALQYSKYRRVGDSIELQLGYAWSGLGSASSIYVTMPSGLSADFSKTYAGATVGSGFMYSSTTGFKQVSTRIDASGLTLYFVKDGTGANLQGNDGPASGSALYVTALVPITGWSSNVAFSSDEPGRPVVAKIYRNNTAQSVATTSSTKWTGDTALIDTVGGFDSAANRYYAKYPGLYRVAFHSTYQNITFGSGVYIQSYIWKVASGVTTTEANNYLYTLSGTQTDAAVDVSTIVKMEAGDYLEFGVLSNDGSYIIHPDKAHTYATIERIGTGSQQIAATENVAIKYTSSATQQIASSTNVTIAYANKVYASHENVWDGTKFTAPVAGLYFVSAATANATLAGPYGGNYIVIAKGTPGAGTAVSGANFPSQVATSLTVSCTVSALVPLLAGETIYIYRVQDSGSNKNLNGDPNLNYISINKVGTY